MVRLAADLDGAAVTASGEPQSARFALAPPRHFLLPAVLLLIAEEPSHGYQLVKALSGLHFGPVDRPAVYRVLAQLEAGGLVEAWSDAPVAGSMRRVYGLTTEGGRMLRAWMGIIKEERDALDGVLRRYAATGTVDALLAEAENGLVAVGGTAWSPVSATAEAGPRPRVVGPCAAVPGAAPVGRAAGSCRPAAAVTSSCRSARSCWWRRGPPSGRSASAPSASAASSTSRWPTGRSSSAAVRAPSSRCPSPRCARAIASTTPSCSGASTRRAYPVVTLDLDQCVALGVGDLYRLEGSATVHGVTRPVTGTVVVHLSDDGVLDVSGDQVFDIRDFGIESPTVLMLRIYPDVTVRLHIEATGDGDQQEVSP